MKKYRKLPVEIEAIQFTGTLENVEEIQKWGEENGIIIIWHYNHGILNIPTLEGDMSAKETDWIIKGVNGEFYPCKDDIFKKTYVEVEDA